MEPRDDGAWSGLRGRREPVRAQRHISPVGSEPPTRATSRKAPSLSRVGDSPLDWTPHETLEEGRYGIGLRGLGSDGRCILVRSGQQLLGGLSRSKGMFVAVEAILSPKSIQMAKVTAWRVARPGFQRGQWSDRGLGARDGAGRPVALHAGRESATERERRTLAREVRPVLRADGLGSFDGCRVRQGQEQRG